MSNRYPSGRAVPLAALSLGPWLLLATACPADGTTTTDSGTTDPSTTTTTGTTEPDATTTTGDPTTTTGTTDVPTSSTTGPAPAMCGDGVVAESEVCDDGNDEPDDGCNQKCEKTGKVLWTYTHDGPASRADSARAVAVDPTGKIILAGFESVSLTDTDMLLIALGPDGKELWKKSYPDGNGLDNSFYDVALDDAGNIYAGGREETAMGAHAAIVRKFDPDGNELWTFAEPSPIMDYTVVEGLLLADGALYSTGYEDVDGNGARMQIRRHDPATGEAVWTTTTQADAPVAVGFSLAKPDDHLRVAGYIIDDADALRPLIVTVDTEGTILTQVVEDHPGGAWFDISTVGDAGDMVLVGRREPPGVTLVDIAVRRIGADGSEKWTFTLDHEFLFGLANGVATGPDEKIFVSGFYSSPQQFDDAFGGLYSGDGAPIWTHGYNNDDIDLYDDGLDAAFGPDFIVLAGQSNVLGQDINVWVRAFAAD